MLPGVFAANKKNGSLYYRASLTHKNKHISLGSFETEREAYNAYLDGDKIIHSTIGIEDYSEDSFTISFDKFISLVNYRDNGIYIKTPIYLKNRYFLYYLAKDSIFKFDIDDLFYYSNHKIMKRNGYLFVSDYGMQTNILYRYGIKHHAVMGKDYIFSNGDTQDYRYGNIEIINRYNGVSKYINKGIEIFRVKIHIVGDYIVGEYENEIEAAIAYNKAIDTLKNRGILINYTENYIENLTSKEYHEIYEHVKISKNIRHFDTLNGCVSEI